MRYLYCTIAIGEDYFNSAKSFAEKLNTFSNNHHMLIVTDKSYDEIKNTTIEIIPNDKTLFIKDVFNYNLKYYPLFLSNKMDYDYIIYVDSDWRVRDSYNPSSVEEMLNFMEQEGYDILFERPHRIGDGKFVGRECFWQHKVGFYNLLDTEIYDNGHVCNEQFIVFKKNDKFNIFVQKWEELYEKATEGELWPFAEGLEIGMSMAFSKMNGCYVSWERFIRQMYEFNSKDGGLNIKF